MNQDERARMAATISNQAMKGKGPLAFEQILSDPVRGIGAARDAIHRAPHPPAHDAPLPTRTPLHAPRLPAPAGAPL